MRVAALLLLALLPCQVLAQEADPAQTERDRSYLTGLIEDNLSGAGRTIRLDGFKGALSSRATFDTLSIADDQGVWLTIHDGAMAWDRTAILAGRIQVQELSAKEIDLARLPGTTATGEPAPEVQPFALPDLPVSVKIGTVHADKMLLGAPVLGQEVALRLDGSLSLAGGEGETQLNVARIDGPKGTLALKGTYSNASRQLLVDLLLDEGKGGIAGALIGLPGNPALTLSASGVGPIDDFGADLMLSTDAVPRVKGKVALKSTTPKQGAGTERSFVADFSGDVTPLLPPEYHEFFGTKAQLHAAGQQSVAGVLSLSQFDLAADAVTLSGAMDLLPSGLPARFDLDAAIGLASGADVLLPLSGTKTYLRDGKLHLAYDRSKGEGWSLQGGFNAVHRDDIAVDRLTLEGSGRIGQVTSAIATAGGTMTFAATGIALPDPAQQAALGPFVSGSTLFFWQTDKPLQLPRLHVSAQDFKADGRMSIDDLAGGIDIAGKLQLDHRNLSNLSALAGRSLQGSAEATVAGSYTVLTGAFDATVDLAGNALHLDQPQLDALLDGAAQISASARRDESGIALRALSAQASGLSLTASGQLSSKANDVTAQFALPDLARVGAGYGGSLGATAHLVGAIGQRQITLSGEGRNIAVAQAEVNRILAGQSLFSAVVQEQPDGFRLSDLSLTAPQLSATAKARAGSEGRTLDVSTRLANMALLAPGFPGPLAVSGDVTDLGGNYVLNLNGTGPGGTEAKVQGSVAADFGTTDLQITGRTETALVNAFIAPQSVQGRLAFDLALRGKPGLDALSGRVIGNGLRLVAPTLGQTLENIELTTVLADGRANVDLRARMGEGGTIALKGPVALSAPYDGQLALTLEQAHLRDPELYDTRISGGLKIAGPLTGAAKISGGLTLDETELRIPSSGLSGAAAIPDITHLHEPAAVHATRVRAGLIEQAGASDKAQGPGMALDVTVSAPRRIFVRGRGLDAELGGALRLTGSTTNIVPIGEFGLIRGRLDILGKRFTLTDGQVALQGALVPWILFSATTEQQDTTITLSIEGDASEPALHITSSPELPEEEVLALLLFDKGLNNLSALQAAQLASAVASLAGKGGEGIVSRLRQGFGLDDLDVGTDESGNATVRAGKYLSENVYSDVAVDSEGKAEINLNLDITSHLTARGTVGSTGDSSLGLFFEKDY